MSDINVPRVAGLAECASLLAAACIGMLVVAVQRWTRREHPLSRSMEQAHVLLCLAGALMMLIVGDSLPARSASPAQPPSSASAPGEDRETSPCCSC